MSVFVLAAALTFAAADNALTSEEKTQGWRLLFDGATMTGWKNSDGSAPRKGPENGAINPHRAGHYMLVFDEPFEDFELKLDFKISPKSNSGVFLRTWPLEPLPGKDVGYNGIEIAIDDTTSAGMTDTGAIYDLSVPKKNAMRPVGEWNALHILCKGPIIDVTLNGEAVNRIDLSQFTAPFLRPDGSAHKFEFAYKDKPARGYIGLQDHGADCWYKNIKLRPIE